MELSATQHVGFYQFTFPKVRTSAVVIDVSHFLNSWRGLGWEQHYVCGNISLSKFGTFEGRGTYNNGWNIGECLCIVMNKHLPF
jgi:hypothetical protein